MKPAEPTLSEAVEDLKTALIEAFRLRELLDWLSRLLCEHRFNRVTWRWIEVNAKRNKPAELLLEAREDCLYCGRNVRIGYFAKEQVDAA